MKTVYRLTVVLLLVTVGAFLYTAEAAAKKVAYEDPGTYYSSFFNLVPPVDSPEPGASGTSTETDGFYYDVSPSWGPEPWGILMPQSCYWYSSIFVTCVHLTPTTLYRVVCHTSQGWDDIHEFLTDKHGKLDVAFGIVPPDVDDLWFRGFTEPISVSAMEIVDEAGNIVLVRVPQN